LANGYFFVFVILTLSFPKERVAEERGGVRFSSGEVFFGNILALIGVS